MHPFNTNLKTAAILPLHWSINSDGLSPQLGKFIFSGNIKICSELLTLSPLNTFFIDIPRFPSNLLSISMLYKTTTETTIYLVNKTPVSKCSHPKSQSTFFTQVQRWPTPRPCSWPASPAPVSLRIHRPPKPIVSPASWTWPASWIGPSVVRSSTGPRPTAWSVPRRRALVPPVVPGGVPSSVPHVATWSWAASGIGTGVSSVPSGTVSSTPRPGSGPAPTPGGSRRGHTRTGLWAAGRPTGWPRWWPITASLGSQRILSFLWWIESQIIHEVCHIAALPGYHFFLARTFRTQFCFYCCSAISSLCSWAGERREANEEAYHLHTAIYIHTTTKYDATQHTGKKFKDN